MKVQCANPINERIYGLNFVNGVSEEFNDQELFDRLVSKGYKPIEEVKEEVKVTDKTTVEVEPVVEVPVEENKKKGK